MPALRQEPDLFDIDGWIHRLGELRAEPQDAWRDALILHAETHIAAISAPAENPASQGA